MRNFFRFVAESLRYQLETSTGEPVLFLISMKSLDPASGVASTSLTMTESAAGESSGPPGVPPMRLLAPQLCLTPQVFRAADGFRMLSEKPSPSVCGYQLS